MITHTNADFLIVIGDRNMKNDTCQARKSGKLVEMKVEERIRLLLLEWGEVSGLRPSAAIADNCAALTQVQLFERLKRHTNVGHVEERTRRLQLSVDELSEWYVTRWPQPSTQGFCSLFCPPHCSARHLPCH